MDLSAQRNLASQLSGGTSSDVIKNLVVRLIESKKLRGSLLDFGAGKGELLRRFVADSPFTELAGTDLFPRPAELPESIKWIHQDLNDPVRIDRTFDVVVCSEVIEHLENPRETFRQLVRLLPVGGTLILTTPNQECIRSYLGLLLSGHFTHFLGHCYPAHITALLRLDLTRICGETGFSTPEFFYTDSGSVPKLTRFSWQRISLGLLRGRLFSDNVGMVATRVR